MSDQKEILQTIESLQTLFEELAVRGLRSIGTEQISTMSMLQEEMERIGATHLAGRIGTVLSCIKNDDRKSAPALMRAQASLRVFERLVTLESAQMQMRALADT